MRILKAWPTKDKKLTQVEKALPYMDGRIYEFDVEDCRDLFGMTILSTYEHITDEENARHTEVLRHNALRNLESILRNGTRLAKGPYQLRLKYTNNTLMYQWTGLRQCRHWRRRVGNPRKKVIRQLRQRSLAQVLAASPLLLRLRIP